jgi:hypothetical protein
VLLLRNRPQGAELLEIYAMRVKISMVLHDGVMLKVRPSCPRM